MLIGKLATEQLDVAKQDQVKVKKVNTSGVEEKMAYGAVWASTAAAITAVGLVFYKLGTPTVLTEEDYLWVLILLAPLAMVMLLALVVFQFMRFHADWRRNQQLGSLNQNLFEAKDSLDTLKRLALRSESSQRDEMSKTIARLEAALKKVRQGDGGDEPESDGAA